MKLRRRSRPRGLREYDCPTYGDSGNMTTTRVVRYYAQVGLRIFLLRRSGRPIQGLSDHTFPPADGHEGFCISARNEHTSCMCLSGICVSLE